MINIVPHSQRDVLSSALARSDFLRYPLRGSGNVRSKVDKQEELEYPCPSSCRCSAIQTHLRDTVRQNRWATEYNVFQS
jgi:hypothetical protein